MTILQLFVSFFLIGLFTFGGGLAALPLIQQQVVSHQWVTVSDFFNMVAVSQSVPGAIAFNLSTFIGFRASGVLGAIISTIAIALPSLLFTVVIARYFPTFKNNKFVSCAFYGLRAAVIGLIATATFNILLVTIININLFKQTSNLLNLIDIKALALFGVVFFLFEKFKLHPIIYIMLGAAAGILFF